MADAADGYQDGQLERESVDVRTGAGAYWANKAANSVNSFVFKSETMV